jgi:hypothetical protein
MKRSLKCTVCEQIIRKNEPCMRCNFCPGKWHRQCDYGFDWCFNCDKKDGYFRQAEQEWFKEFTCTMFKWETGILSCFVIGMLLVGASMCCCNKRPMETIHASIVVFGIGTILALLKHMLWYSWVIWDHAQYLEQIQLDNN